MYGGNFRLLDKVGKNLGIDVSIVDASNLDTVKNAIKPNTKVRCYTKLLHRFYFLLSLTVGIH